MSELRRYEYTLHWLLPSLLLRGFGCRVDREPVEGDLVMLQSAPLSDWQLSIYRECSEGGYYDRKHLLESLKTGQLCDWSNVGFHVLKPDIVCVDDRWRWSDEQFAFSDKFEKVYRNADFHMAIPFIVGFDGDVVNITFRTRFSFDENLTRVPPFEWRKITQKALMAKLIEYESIHKQKGVA